VQHQVQICALLICQSQQRLIVRQSVLASSFQEQQEMLRALDLPFLLAKLEQQFQTLQAFLFSSAGIQTLVRQPVMQVQVLPSWQAQPAQLS
jgi:hypothetical protein